jgi:iron complex transport system permease protein
VIEQPAVVDAPRLAIRGPALRLATGVVALGALALAASAGILVGPVPLDPGAVLRELAGALPFVDAGSGLSAQHRAILWELRLPRVALGGLVGATLSLAGAAYQGVFRNPLADPYLLGAAAGAGLGATLVIVYAPGAVGGAAVDPLPIAAFVGALAGVAIAYVMGSAGARGRTTTSLILAGVATASFLTAVQTYVQQRQSETLREVYTWILGRLATAGWHEVLLILPYTAISAVAILLHRRLLDVLSVGDEEAAGLGVRVARVRLVVIAAASLGTAAAVAVSGLIGFVGIIVPHAVRLAAGSSYRVVLPLSAIGGAAFVIVADLAARTVAAPAELPIGVVTAFVGAPFFAMLLRRSGRAT